MRFRVCCCAIFMYMFLLACRLGHAGVIEIRGVADPDTAYYEYGADAFFRMDLYDPPPRQTQQRFHSIADPSVTFGNLAFDGFPNDGNFRFGTITFDDTSIINGNGTANITGINLGIVSDALDPSYLNYGRWTNVTTVVDAFAGTISFAGGIVADIQLQTTAQLLIPSLSTSAPGYFNIAGNRFDGNFVIPAVFGNQAVYDMQGSIVAVPEPISVGLIGLAGSFAIARRRRKK